MSETTDEGIDVKISGGFLKKYGTGIFRAIMIVLVSGAGGFSYLSQDNNESVKVQLKIIDFKLDEYLSKEKYLEGKIESCDKENTEAHDRIKSDIETFKDQYVFRNPAFQPRRLIRNP